jgi:hypothetical protein
MLSEGFRNFRHYDRNHYGERFQTLVQQAQVILFWVFELQHSKVTLQNKLNQDQDAVHADLTGAMHTELVDYTSYVMARGSLSIFTNLWEKTYIH